MFFYIGSSDAARLGSFSVYIAPKIHLTN